MTEPQQQSEPSEEEKNVRDRARLAAADLEEMQDSVIDAALTWFEHATAANKACKVLADITRALPPGETTPERAEAMRAHEAAATASGKAMRELKRCCRALGQCTRAAPGKAAV